MISREASLKLEWWSTRTNLLSGKLIRPQEPDLVIETDALMLSWGAVCSRWADREQEPYKLLAATFAMKTFTKDIRSAHIQENNTAVFYVNSMGGTHSTELNNPERNMSLTAENLPGVDICIADKESRTIQFTAEWQLHPTTFQLIMQTLGWICLRHVSIPSWKSL